MTSGGKAFFMVLKPILSLLEVTYFVCVVSGWAKFLLLVNSGAKCYFILCFFTALSLAALACGHLLVNSFLELSDMALLFLRISNFS